MSHQLQATPDQVIAVVSGVVGGAVVAAIYVTAVHLRGRVTPTRRQRRRAVARDVRALERNVR